MPIETISRSVAIKLLLVALAVAARSAFAQAEPTPTPTPSATPTLPSTEPALLFDNGGYTAAAGQFSRNYGFGYTMYEDFALEADATLNDIRWSGGEYQSTGTSRISSWDVTIYDDLPGTGNLILSASLAPDTAVFLAHVGSSDRYDYAISGLSVELAGATTYWLGLSTTTGQGGNWSNTSGTASTIDGLYQYSPNGSLGPLPGTFHEIEDAAFQLYGAMAAPGADCLCEVQNINPNQVVLRNVGAGGRGSEDIRKMVVALNAVDAPGATCDPGEFSTPTPVNLKMEDDSGNILIDSAEIVVCEQGVTTNLKREVLFQGPMNCGNGAVPPPNRDFSLGTITSTGSAPGTADYVEGIKIKCFE